MKILEANEAFDRKQPKKRLFCANFILVQDGMLVV